MDEFREHDALAVPFAVREVAVDGQVTDRPEDGLVVVASEMLPAKLFRLVKETDKDEDAPGLKLTGLATTIEKSPTWTVEEVEWAAVPINAEAMKFT